jgi:hypothetical protein
MKLDQAIDKYFSKNELIDAFTKCELYYQLGLLRIVYRSTLDINETNEKINELKLKLDSQTVIRNIYDILVHFSKDNYFEEKMYDYHLQTRTLANVLNDFINSDKDLNKPELFADQIYEEIMLEIFFDEELQKEFEDNYDLTHTLFSNTFTKEIADDIKKSIQMIHYGELK